MAAAARQPIEAAQSRHLQARLMRAISEDQRADRTLTTADEAQFKQSMELLLQAQART